MKLTYSRASFAAWQVVNIYIYIYIRVSSPKTPGSTRTRTRDHRTTMFKNMDKTHNMVRPRQAHGGGALATDSPPTESIPEASASKKLTARVHLLQVRWTATNFDKFKYTILEFANEFMRINKAQGLSVTHKTIVCYWNLLVWSFYSNGNAISNKLESQVCSPQIQAPIVFCD